MKRAEWLIPTGLVLVGGLLLGNGTWIHGKAWLAQQLVKHAWAETLAGGHPVRPWPWADTWPVAKLTVEGIDVEYYILSGATGNALAFGPGHYQGTALPGTGETSVIAGHRDTQFRFLENIAVGDLLLIENSEGKTIHYRVSDKAIFDSRLQKMDMEDANINQIKLVTCYPFNAINPGGPLRMVVTAPIEF